MLCLVNQMICGATCCAIALLPVAFSLLHLREPIGLHDDFDHLLAIGCTAVIGGASSGCAATIIYWLRSKPTNQRKVRFARQ